MEGARGRINAQKRNEEEDEGKKRLEAHRLTCASLPFTSRACSFPLLLLLLFISLSFFLSRTVSVWFCGTGSAEDGAGVGRRSSAAPSALRRPRFPSLPPLALGRAVPHSDPRDVSLLPSRPAAARHLGRVFSWPRDSFTSRRRPYRSCSAAAASRPRPLPGLRQSSPPGSGARRGDEERRGNGGLRRKGQLDKGAKRNEPVADAAALSLLLSLLGTSARKGPFRARRNRRHSIGDAVRAVPKALFLRAALFHRAPFARPCVRGPPFSSPFLPLRFCFFSRVFLLPFALRSARRRLPMPLLGRPHGGARPLCSADPA